MPVGRDVESPRNETLSRLVHEDQSKRDDCQAMGSLSFVTKQPALRLAHSVIASTVEGGAVTMPVCGENLDSPLRALHGTRGGTA